MNQRFLKSLIIQLTFIIYLIESKKYTCVFDQMYKNYKPHENKALHRDIPLTINVKGRKLITSSRTPIRITLDTSYIDNSVIQAGQNGAANTTTAHLAYIKKAMLVAKEFYQARLQVTQVVKIIAPTQCFDFNPPIGDTQLTGGIAFSDLHIYVRYLTDKNTEYGATGVSCKTFDGTSIPDSTFQRGRPTVGRIIFNTYSLLQGEGISNDQALLTNRRFNSITATALHETMHILGFDSQLYETYINPNSVTGTLYAAGSYLSGPTQLHAQRPASYLLKTPNLVAWAKDFFDCSSITGMQLENQDGGTIGSHWQRVIMYDQLMTGTKMGPSKSVSGATFALLKDMGWYDVDATFNDTMNYGYKKGCTFYTDACYPTMSVSKYFCNINTQTFTYCSTNHMGKAYCENQAAAMADGCGVWLDYRYCVDPDQSEANVQQYTLQVYGTTSFCVVGTMGRQALSQTSKSRCYPHVCTYLPSAQSIIFTIGTYNLTCLKTDVGLKKTLSAFPAGYIQCPNYDDYCVNNRKICKNWCSQNGFCMRGVCNCLPGYSGDDCSKVTCTETQYYNPLTNTCGSSCPSGYYQNVYSKTCMQCASNCQQCAKQAHICTSCHSTVNNPLVFYIDTCYTKCPDGTYQNGDICYACTTVSPTFCKTCQGSPTDCTSCQTGYFLINPTKGSCNLNCPDTTYKLQDMVNNKCVDNCKDNLILNDTFCVLCPQGQYKWIKDGNCHSDCAQGFYKDEADRFCRECNKSCQYCDGKYPENCTKCWSNSTDKYLLLKMCLSSCPSGYYANDTSGVCQVCSFSLNCASCYYDATLLKVRCYTCKYGYYYQSNNKTCLLSCDQYKYKNKWNHSCDDCSSQCGDCTSPYQSSCINCRSNKFYLSNQTGGYCLDNCPTLYYVKSSTNCLPCHKTCKQCNGVTSQQCVSCVSGLYYYQGYCRYVCPQMTYPNEETYECTACNSKCKFCFGNTVDNCTSCIDSLVLNNYTCTTSCPQGMIVNQWSVCQKWGENLKLLLGNISIIILSLLIITN